MSKQKSAGFMDFKEDLDWLEIECKQYVENLPAPLDELGREYFCRIPWFNWIGTALPFWVGDIYKSPKDLTRTVALPSYFASIYMFLQDNIMDESDSQWTRLSPFGTILFTDMMKKYQTFFPQSSSFWDYFGQYITEWTQSISWETDRWDMIQDYDESDLLLIAHKAALVKLSAMSVTLLAGHEEAIKPLSQYVDYTQVVYDLIDQSRDWREDLQNRHYGYLLTKVIIDAGLVDSKPPSEESVQRAFLFSDTVDSVYYTAIRYSHLARDCAVRLDGRFLIEHADALAESCEQILSQITSAREQIL